MSIRARWGSWWDGEGVDDAGGDENQTLPGPARAFRRGRGKSHAGAGRPFGPGHFDIHFVLLNARGEYAHLLPKDIPVIDLGIDLPGPYQLTGLDSLWKLSGF